MTSMMDLLSVSGNWIWPDGRTPLLVTNHGAHLYGTATASTGRGIYAVLTEVGSTGWSDTRTENGVWVHMLDFGSWMNRCAAAEPLAMEAMFAIDPELEDLGILRVEYRVTEVEWSHYLRSIASTAESEVAADRVNSLRLAWNMYEMRTTGRCNPTLHPAQVQQYRTVAERYEGQALLDIALRVAWT